MNRSFKIVGRNPETGRQEKKTVYTSETDYRKYKFDIIRRWTNYMRLHIETYELIDEKWIPFYDDEDTAIVAD